MKARVETAPSVKRHDTEQHRVRWVGKTEDWYGSVGGGMCPACGVKPDFETIDIEMPKLGMKVKGLSSGEGLRY